MCFCDNYKYSNKMLYGTIHRIQSENSNNKKATVENVLFSYSKISVFLV